MHQISRRSLLKTAGVLGASGVGGWGLPAAHARSVHSNSGNALRALGRDMDGRLLLPSDEGYSIAVVPNNGRWGHVRPRGIALCTTPADVQRCIRWATEHGEPFAVRSGGHSYAGFSTTPGLLISVRHLNAVNLNLKDGLVTIQGGVNNQDMADGLRKYGVAVPTGRCPTVGASGLTLGGGWGFAASHSGLTCDSLLATDVVLPNAKMVQASAQQEPDLFWAARGGGGGNFGVHTALTYKLREVGNITTFNIVWPPGRQLELLQLLQSLQLQNPRSLSTRTKARPQKAGSFPQRDQLLVETLGVYWGGQDALRALLAPAISLLKPDVMDIREQPYWQARDYLVTDDPTGLYDLRSSYVAQSLGSDALETMLQWMSKWPGGTLLQENMGILFTMGGAVNDVAVDATAYAHRSSTFIFEQEAMWSPLDKPAVVQRQRAWLADYFAAMQPYLQQRSYINFPNRDMKDWARRYYAGNLERLSEVKRRYDPQNVFRFAQSIPLVVPA